jgi:hypothetical protein
MGKFRKLSVCLLALAGAFVLSRAVAQERGGRGPAGTEVHGKVTKVDEAGLKITDNGPHVQLRMSLDQKKVQAITTSTGGARR